MRKKYFSIVELLVVIAIIAVLSGILMSALGGAISKKDKANTVKVIKDLEIAFQKYYNANGEYPATDNSGLLTSAIYLQIRNDCSISDDYISSNRPITAWGGNIFYISSDDYTSPTLTITPATNDAGIPLNPDTIQIIAEGNPANFTGNLTNY